MGADARQGRVIQADGRSKAYRPIPEADRTAALLDGLAAYDRGDYFLAHELLEPAWMGTDDITERALIQGLIKVAAAGVHGVRGNPRGVTRNMEGARDRLREAAVAGATSAGVEIDLDDLLATIDHRLDQEPTDAPAGTAPAGTAPAGTEPAGTEPANAPVPVHWRAR